jgi:hypothetical protein
MVKDYGSKQYFKGNVESKTKKYVADIEHQINTLWLKNKQNLSKLSCMVFIMFFFI